MEPKSKTENKNQVLKRSVAGLERYCKDLIERLGIPIFLHYLNPITNKTGYITDSETEATLKNCEIIDKLETILHASHKLGTNLTLVTDTTKEASNNEQTQAPCNSNKIKSHLPAPVFKLVSERSKYTFDNLRSLLGSALNNEGFGRGTGKKRYKEEATRPAWYNKDLEVKTGIPWDKFTGVNVKGEKEKKEVMYEIVFAMYSHHLKEKVDDYILYRSDECNLAQELKKKANQNRLQKEINKVAPPVPLQLPNDSQQDRQNQESASQPQFYEHPEDHYVPPIQLSQYYPPQMNTNFNLHHNIAYHPQPYSENYINLSAPTYLQQGVPYQSQQNVLQYDQQNLFHQTVQDQQTEANHEAHLRQNQHPLLNSSDQINSPPGSFHEPLSNFRQLVSPAPIRTPIQIHDSRMSMTPKQSSILKTPISRASISRTLFTPGPSSIPLKPVAEESEESLKTQICKINMSNNNNPSQNIESMIPPESPFPQLKKKSNNQKNSESLGKLTHGWLEDVFKNMKETSPGKLQLLNWRYKPLNNSNHLCLAVGDGKHVTKHILINEELEEIIKITRLYSIFEVTEATIIDGCMLRLDEIKILSENETKPIIIGDELEQIEKNYILKILINKGMYKNGIKVTNHPGFSKTPIVKRTRSRVQQPEDLQPHPKRLQTGGFNCDICMKTYKTKSTLQRHKCK